MIAYKDIDNDSGVTAYSISSTSIEVQFRKGKIYDYPISIIGEFNYLRMCELAKTGDGLNSYINRVIKRIM